MITSEIRPAAYQLVPLTKLITSGLNGILIADGVGLGKTISSSLIATYYSESRRQPTVIICSPTLLTKWLTELSTKFGVSAIGVRSKEHLKTLKRDMRIRPRDFYVLSNSLLLGNAFQDFPPIGLLILDEIQYYRNEKTKSYLAALELSKKSAVRIGLSATPINNSLDDLASEIALLLAEENWEAVSALVSDLWDWKKERITTPFVTRFVKERLGGQFARRRIRMINIEYPALYTEKVNQVLMSRATGSGSYRVATYLRLAASCPRAFLRKFHVDLEDIEDSKLKVIHSLLEMPGIDHWLIFVEFQATAKFLQNVIVERPVFTITGKTPLSERDETIQVFRDRKRSALILTPVGSEGLDLQFCQGVINYDLHWNPMKIEQRVGRIDRIGQSKRIIEIINLRVIDSIDDHVLRVILKKLSLTQRSIFATGKIVETETRPAAVTRKAMESELDETKHLISALRYTDTLGEEDYMILPYIKDEFCNPSLLSKIARKEPFSTVWLRDESYGENWRRSIAKEAIKLKEDLEKYK